MSGRKPIDERVVRYKSGRYAHEREYMPKRRFSRRGMYDTASGERTQFVTIRPAGRPDVRLIVGCLPEDTTRGACRSTSVQKSVRRVTPQQAAGLRRRGVRTIRKNPSKGRRLVARWQTRGGRYWYELYKDAMGFAYRGDSSGGNIGNVSEPEAIRHMERMVAGAAAIDGIKMSRTTRNPGGQALTAAWLTNPRRRKKNPQLMVVSNPRKKRSSGKAPSESSRAAKLTQQAYKRFHFTKPVKSDTGWVPDGWPKTYMTIGTCLKLVVQGANGKKVTRNWSGRSGPRLCTTSAMKDVFLFGNLKGIPSGTAVQVDYRVPAHSKRRKWAPDWTHDHNTRPRLTAHKSGKAIRISGRGLKVTPRGIEG